MKYRKYCNKNFKKYNNYRINWIKDLYTWNKLKNSNNKIYRNMRKDINNFSLEINNCRKIFIFWKIIGYNKILDIWGIKVYNNKNWQDLIIMLIFLNLIKNIKSMNMKIIIIMRIFR
jgi:hypothetical protein